MGAAMKYWLTPAAALFLATQAQAQTAMPRVATYFPSCLAAADIAQGKRPAADSEEASRQLRTAAICFGAVTAIMNLEPYFKPEFAICPPTNTQISQAQIVLTIVNHFKAHPEKLQDNFFQAAVAALAAAWPCPK